MFLFCSLILGVKAQETEWKVEIGEQSPKFEVTSKDGNTQSSTELIGKVVLVNFFATWCPPCREELPLLESQIWERWKERDDFEVMVLAREEGWDKLGPFLEKNPYTFPIYPDLQRGVFGLFADSYIPRNIVLDKEGRVVYRSIGFEREEFAKMVTLIEEELNR